MSSNNWETQLSEVERTAYTNYFKRVDADEKGIVLHDEAMDFLKKSDIPENILKQFWSACDNENKGFLTEQEFCTILKLIACAQHGVVTGDPILATQVSLPEFNGTGASANTGNYNNNNNNFNRPPMPIPPQATGNVDLVSPEDRQKYIGLFNSFGPENNILSGERARAAFVQSNLPNTTLQTIWNLADTRRSGSLNQTEFIIAMFYIERAMRGQTQFPPTLPASVYASATGRPPASPLVRNNTLQVSSPPPVPRRSPVFKGRTVAPVHISPEEYRKYQQFFSQLDTDNSGFVSGADAVVFFKHSKLPDADLARIWDLADTNSTGQLNEQEFATAMHMINQRVAGGDIPSSLPNLNTNYQPQQQRPQQPMQQPPQQQNVDLLGLDSDFAESSFTPTTPSYQQQPPQQQNVDLARSQSTLLQTSVNNEMNRAQSAQQQFTSESQAVQELLKQIEMQKETLAKLKAEAEEAERQLEAEKKRKETLTQELQMYKQETKHFSTRVENAQEETKKVQKEIEELEKNKASPAPPQQSTLFPSASHNDFFTLSTAPSPAAGGGLFAKVSEPATANTSLSPKASNSTALFAKVNESSSPQKTFDPFAGFKASNNSAAPSPTISMNKLKEEAEQKRSATPNSYADLGDIESKFPDLSTMEQNFAPPPSSSAEPPATSTVASPTVSVASAPVGSPHTLFKKTQVTPSPLPSKSSTMAPEPKNPSVSKYGFDLSAFETSSNTASSPFGQTSMKDELSSLFGSPSTASAQLPQQKPQSSSGFDDIFGNAAAKPQQSNTTDKPNETFENIFFQK